MKGLRFSFGNSLGLMKIYFPLTQKQCALEHSCSVEVLAFRRAHDDSSAKIMALCAARTAREQLTANISQILLCHTNSCGSQGKQRSETQPKTTGSIE